MQIFRENPLLKNPSVVEKKYKAKYLGDFCVKNKIGWVNQLVSVFYTKEAHPEGSNYFGIYLDNSTPMITNAITAVTNKDGTPVIYTGVLLTDKVRVLYSAYRHDYQSVDGVFVDGGRDYLRTNKASADWVNFIINKDEIKFLDKESF